jgi:Domain of unknown function (DUF4276)
LKTLVFLVEELSAQEMLKALVPRIVGADIEVVYISFNGKTDLENSVERKLRGFLKPDARFLILRDKDSENCIDAKNRLLKSVDGSGRASTSLVRIACHELESFYLGDLQAVEKALQLKNLSQKQAQRKFRNPDTLANPCQELGKLTASKYQKVMGSRLIGAHLNLESNQSLSFLALVSAIRKLAQ